jgi:hypothetical protein
MDRKKELVFKYFDMVFRGYKKHGRRPVDMKSPHVLFEYKNDNGRVGFEYSTWSRFVKFDESDFNTAKNVFGIKSSKLEKICLDYVADKFNDPTILKTFFMVRTLN